MQPATISQKSPQFYYVHLGHDHLLMKRARQSVVKVIDRHHKATMQLNQDSSPDLCTAMFLFFYHQRRVFSFFKGKKD